MTLLVGNPRDLLSVAASANENVPRVKQVGVMGRFDADVQRLPPPGQARWAADVMLSKLGDASSHCGAEIILLI